MNKIIHTFIFGIIFYCSVVDTEVVQVSQSDLPLFQRKVQGRIVGGTRSGPNQFPYTVSIRAYNGSSTSFCGGSMISSTYILTAAHCTRGFHDFEIGLGSIVLNTPVTKIFTYSGAIEHPEFNPSNLNNDIALIKVPIIPSNIPATLVLLPRYSQADKTFVGAQATVSGFGRTSDTSNNVSPFMEYVTLKVIPNKECFDLYGKRIVTDNVLCAKGIDKMFNACLGDSGGPLVAKDGGIPVQIGIVSFVSSRGCAEGDPSGYTRVSKYLKWISSKTGIRIRD
ncbi:serine protease 3-like [Chironomus tepperi]|uniref:serine protease 3-like n=1 Tax=Chironomus tepperi TaxID=113505 RepID=UPI00391F4DE9